MFWEKGSQSIPTGPSFRTAMYPASTKKSDEIALQRTADPSFKQNKLNFLPNQPHISCFSEIPVFMTWRSSVM
jgi:hypothetical protein